MAWALSLAALAAIIIVNHRFYAQDDIEYSPLAYGLHDGLSRVIWSTAICYIVFACIHSSGGLINWFLSHRWWTPLARISFSIYIVHRPIPLLTVGTMKIPPVMSEATFSASALLNCILSICVAIVATLAFESPIISLEKVFFGSKLKKDENKMHEN